MVNGRPCKPNVAPDDGAIAAEVLAPDRLAHHRHHPPVVSDRVIVRRQRAADERPRAEHVEIAAADEVGLQPRGAVSPLERQAVAGRPWRDGGERSRFPLQLGELRIGQLEIGVAFGTAESAVDERQPIRLRIGQRPQDQRIDDGEDRGVGADAESERQDRQQREAGARPSRRIA